MMEKLQPKLRFPEFKGDLPVFRFGDLYSFFSTNSLSRDKMNYEEGEVYNIHYGDIHTKFNSRFILENELVPRINLDVDISKFKEELYCQNGDIIIADASEDYADIGKSIEIINTNNQKLLAGLHTFLARPITNKTSLGFINIALKSWNLRKQIMLIAQGTKVLSLSSSRFADLKLHLPSLPEQKKIASFLTTLDDKISNLKQKVSILEKYKKGVMQQIFSQQIRFKDTSGNDYPEWEEKSLGEVCEFYSGGTPLTTNKNFYNGNIPFIKSGEIGEKETKQFITELGLKNSSAKLVSKGDILYALYGATSGEVSISQINGAINQAVLCIKSSQNQVYLFQYLKYQKDNIVSTFIQGGQGNLSANIIKELNVALPSIKEQTKIAEFLSGIDEKIETTKAQLSKMEVWKKGLLQGMFC